MKSKIRVLLRFNLISICFKSKYFFFKRIPQKIRMNWTITQQVSFVLAPMRINKILTVWSCSSTLTISEVTMWNTSRTNEKHVLQMLMFRNLCVHTLWSLMRCSSGLFKEHRIWYWINVSCSCRALKDKHSCMVNITIDQNQQIMSAEHSMTNRQ